KIAMTAPVETSSSGDRMTMRFFLPEGMTLEDAPRPTDPAVALREIAPRTEAALTFSGYYFVSGALERAPELREALANSGWTPSGEVTTYFYDPPWTLPWNRRNEVVVEVAPTPSG
ncbi:MAG: heme-binding protein, partial [Pseudomonadota bacterium]